MNLPRDIPNPYLDEFRRVMKLPKNIYDFAYFKARDPLVLKYAWAIPSTEAILVCVKFSPIVEIGAGLGYWAKLISDNGGQIVAFDHKPGFDHTEKPQHPWFDVKYGTPETVTAYPDHTLLLCWPPYDDPMADTTLRLYTGRHVIYIGEGPYGCTGDDNFHDQIDRDWEKIQTVKIPQWTSIHDRMHVYIRKNP